MSGYQSVGPTHTRKAGVDLSNHRHRAVDINTSGDAILPEAGGAVVGICFNGAIVGYEVSIQHDDFVEVEFGGTVTPRDAVKVDALGRIVTASSDDVSAGRSIGRCYEGGTIGKYGTILLMLSPGNSVTSTPIESIADDVDHTVNPSLTSNDTLITLGTTNFVGVLGNGSFVGQKKRFRVIAASGGFTYQLTVTTMQSGQPLSVFTFTAKNQYLELTWASDGWWITDGKVAGTATPAAAGTINPLCALNVMTVGSAGAEDRILPNGLWAGQAITIVAGTVGSGTTTISGLFFDEDGSADGVDLNFNASGDQATIMWEGSRWIPTSLISVTVS